VIGKITVLERLESRWRWTITPESLSARLASSSSTEVAKLDCGQRLKLPSVRAIPSRNAIVLMCPSPTARSDITKRTERSSRPLWSGCGTIDGFISAAAA